MRKYFTRSGTAGVFNGYVEIVINKIGRKTVHNPSTHDEDERVYTFHKVYGVAGDEQFESSELRSDEAVITEVNRITVLVNSALESQCNRIQQTLESQLHNLGFI